MNTAAATPMIQQYLTIKQKYEDTLLFYRMGDFYEMFFDDAKTASRVLEIALTSRNKKDPVPVPMCGVPYRAAQSYIAKLVNSGYKVAICDQVEDAAAAKGLVKREVVRVVTPGMILENELLEAKANNYLLAVSFNDKMTGLAYLDISTGTFRVSETNDLIRLMDEIQRVSPREILLPASLKKDSRLDTLESAIANRAVNWLEDENFGAKLGKQRLIDQLQTLNLEGFGCQHYKIALGAAGALLHYIQETQKQPVTHFQRIEPYNLAEQLDIDHQSRVNLELERNLRNGSRQGTLISIIDKTLTSMGGRCMKQWLRYPLISVEKIEKRLDAVQEAIDQSEVRSRIRQDLDDIYDLERLISKISMGHANARDLTALKRSLMALPQIWEALEAMSSDLFSTRPPNEHLVELSGHIDQAIREDAPPSLNEGCLIKQGYNEQLDELIRICTDGKGYLAQLEAREKQETGINTLKVRFNKVFGYYIEIPKSQSKLAPQHYVRKQTLVNAERYITDELKKYEAKVLGAEEKRNKLEQTLFNQVRDRVSGHNNQIMAAAGFLARMDCLLALAEVADQNDYHRPKINTQGHLRIQDGRHPVIEKMIAAERFVPNTIELDNANQQIIIITGPNMAGKSTVLRQVALIVILAQMGSFVPACQADIAVTDRIFTRVGALDNLSAGQSTFMVEMQETANILNNATSQSLVIMDEIGRGTSTYDGLSIAWAVVEYLHQLHGKGVKTLFATHYHELTQLAKTNERIENYNIAVKECNDQIIFLRKLIAGGANRSYGIQVAKLAGIPQTVIQRSKTILDRIENSAPSGHQVRESNGPDYAIEHKTPVQMDLFQPVVDTKIADRLKNIDLNNTTPMQALELIMQLQAIVRPGP
ncbi:MAG: DNA mismatch repair protein MutS [Desulfobacteraceae bacterium]|nr:DNA mismatch repair protein MutS [Desulfobacteraceae bacterium]